jgi:ubiquinone/menaquinone biosynthesis C-methylase UbiE
MLLGIIPPDNTNAKSSLDFRLMSLTYRVRDLLRPRSVVLVEVGIKTGFQVLDYGCGPGSYITLLAQLVGRAGKIYALDINPLAIRAVRRLVSKKGLVNVETILSGGDTGLPSSSVDVVLLYDILHDLDEPARVLEEVHRVLRKGGILSVSDHHTKGEGIVAEVTQGGLFRLSTRGKRTHSFVRA